MEQIKILGVAPENSIADIKQILDYPEINCISAIPIEENLLNTIVSLPFDAVVMYSEKMDHLDFRFLESLYMARKDVAYILLYDQITTENYEEAMHCGVTKVISTETEPDDLCQQIIEETRRCANRKQHALVREYDSRVISFYSSKGGAGKTTSAVNTATALASLGKKVILVDGDLQFGDIACFLNIDNTETIAELVKESNITPAIIKHYIKESKFGISVIPAPLSPERAFEIAPDRMETIISMLRADYDFVILDMSADLTDNSVVCFEASDSIFFIVNPEVTTMRNAKVCINTLNNMGFGNRIKVILTKEGHSYVTAKDVKSSIGLTPVAVIPFDIDNVIEANNMGTPLVLNAPASKSAKAYMEFVTGYFNITKPETEKTQSVGVKNKLNPFKRNK